MVEDQRSENGVRLTLGQRRVRLTFNPSGRSRVDTLKQLAADIIDLCEEMKPGANNEVVRLLCCAQTEAENAAMWAVKAATA